MPTESDRSRTPLTTHHSLLPHFHLPKAPMRPTVAQQTKPPDSVATLEASPRVEPGLQRLSSSKGQTRREAATQSHGPCTPGPDAQASEGAWSPGCRRGGLAKSPSVPGRPTYQKCDACAIQGLSSGGYVTVCLATVSSRLPPSQGRREFFCISTCLRWIVS